MDAFSPRTLWDEYGIGADIIVSASFGINTDVLMDDLPGLSYH
jgi:hypothetical protein